MTPNDAERVADVGCNPSEERVPRELGDIVICPEHTIDLREAVVHGALHLVGMDHETDEGQMLAVQAEILRWVGS
jgi:ssRNA-specific RNase YbeY (16S rRNA maturation enzyme)